MSKTNLNNLNDRTERMIDKFDLEPNVVHKPDGMWNLYGHPMLIGFIGESIGMFCFVFVIGVGNLGFWLYVGLYCALMLMVNVSGCHYNPNITIGQYLCFKKDGDSLTKLVLWIIAQFIGSSAAILFTYRISNHEKIIAPVVNAITGTTTALIHEFITGGFLVFTNLYVCHPKTSPSKHTWVNVAIFNSVLFFEITMIAGITGASLNPAIAISGNFWGMYLKGKPLNDYGSYGRSLWINSMGPFFGMLAFTYIYRWFFKKIYVTLRRAVLCNLECTYKMKIVEGF